MYETADIRELFKQIKIIELSELKGRTVKVQIPRLDEFHLDNPHAFSVPKKSP